MTENNAVCRHYARTDIVARLLAALRAVHGAAVALTPATLAPLDHFHRGGLAATRRLAAMLDPRPGGHLLDIGAGIGGPARWIAEQFGCHVTGVDLVPEYCEAARELTALTGMTDRVSFLEGDAAGLPLENAVFDHAFSHSALMNVANKARSFREAFRVLKPGGKLVLFIIGAGRGGDPYLPAPFADTPEATFLQDPEATRRDLRAAGFEITVFRDVTDVAIQEQRDYLRRLEAHGLPALGWHVLMGPEQSQVMQANAARSFIEGRIVELEIVAQRLPIT